MSINNRTKLWINTKLTLAEELKKKEDGKDYSPVVIEACEAALRNIPQPQPTSFVDRSQPTEKD